MNEFVNQKVQGQWRGGVGPEQGKRWDKRYSSKAWDSQREQLGDVEGCFWSLSGIDTDDMRRGDTHRVKGQYRPLAPILLNSGHK